jgi:hypothetical protein
MKTWRILGTLVVVILALGALGVGVVFAKSAVQAWGPFGQGIGGMVGHMRDSGMMNGGTGMMNGGSGSAGMMGSSGQNHMNGIDMDAMHTWMMSPGGMHEQVLNDLAGALGLTPDELTAELQNNRTLVQIAQEKGVSSSELAGILETAVEAAMKKAVADGTLNQQQADAMLNQMKGSYEQMLSFMGLGMGSGAGSCHGNESNDTVAPNATSF